MHTFLLSATVVAKRLCFHRYLSVDSGGVRGAGGCVAGEVCMAGGVHGEGACVAGETATAADGTHPNGMHSC